MGSGGSDSGPLPGPPPQTQAHPLIPWILMAAADSMSFLSSAQNRDGGWGYKSGGGSWTEPTAFALLALAAAGSDSAGYRCGLGWLQTTQRRDGGWAPQPSVDRSTWVTGLAILALLENGDSARLQSALAWLAGQTGEEATFFSRLRRLLLGQHLEVGEVTQGSSWFPRTAAC